MARIDDPLDQIESQHREQGSQFLTVALSLAGPLMDLLALNGVPLVTVFGLVHQFTTDAKRAARAEAFQNGLREGFGTLERRVDEFERKLSGPDAEETVIVAIQSALRAGRLEKARRIGAVLGRTLADDPSDWVEASEFIRNLEEIGEQDIEALKVVWSVQRSACQHVSLKKPEMSTDANKYTSTWNDILGKSAALQMTRDDWYSRCARLNGFGLTVLVQPNGAHQGPDAMCYRLTGRAVRLLRLLGRNVDPRAYPSVRYHRTKPPKTVNDEDEDRAIGDGWADTPAAFEK